MNTSTNYTTNKTILTKILAERIIRRIQTDYHICGFTDQQLSQILNEATSVLKLEPATLCLTAPLVIFGDIHGQLLDLLKFLSVVGTPPNTVLLFLGDYVDRGKLSLEVVITLLLCYKVLYPNSIYLIRGNHECSRMNALYGFREELIEKRSSNIWKKYNEVFDHFPLCATIDKTILCMHGGLSPLIQSWDSLLSLKKPSGPDECDEGIALDLMWSDPTTDACCPVYAYNSVRYTSVIFGKRAVKELCEKLSLKLIVRAHEVVPNGHLWEFDNHIVTIFSAPNYCGSDGNSGSVMRVSKNLKITFCTLKPLSTPSIIKKKELKMVENEANSPDPLAKQSVK